MGVNKRKALFQKWISISIQFALAVILFFCFQIFILENVKDSLYKVLTNGRNQTFNVWEKIKKGEKLLNQISKQLIHINQEF